MNITYISSSGNVYPLMTDRIRVLDANFHAWEFKDVSTDLEYGSRVSRFKKQAMTYQTKIIVRGSRTQRKAALNVLHDEFENDLRKLQPGRIIWGEWHCDCYITSSQTQPYEDGQYITENTVDIFVPSGFWQREETRSFIASSPAPTGFLEFPFDIEYDYTPPSASNATWETDSPFPADFTMKIKGPCVNPRVTVNGYPYIVNAAIPAGATLVIDSQYKTVMMGEINLFDARGKERSVFAKIPSGGLNIGWGGFDFDLTLYEERSEPRW